MKVLTTILALGCGVATAAEPTAVIDWSAWDAMLRIHVVDGSVDYDGIRSESRFAATVEAIAGADLTGHGLEERLAFLINSYNVLAIRGILDGRSPRSGLGKLNFFYRTKYTLAGERMSLNTLEHDWIRTLGEPRIHFAIVCASTSCPPLRSEAYDPERLDEQLDDNARIFLNDPSKNRYDRDRGVAELSKIFKWFREDFGDSPEGVQRFIARWVDDAEVTRQLEAGGFRIRYLDYDWTLNGTLAVE